MSSSSPQPGVPISDIAVPAAARWADLLTGGRLIATLPLAYAAYRASWGTLALLLAAAWWSDHFDGVLARRAGSGTRFAGWDLRVDTAVGGSIVAGLVAGGHISAWHALVLAALAAGFVVLNNPAWSMLLQAVGYGWSLWFTFRHHTAAFGVLVVSIGSIALLGRSRLFGYVLPAFFQGIVGMSGTDSSRSPSGEALPQTDPEEA